MITDTTAKLKIMIIFKRALLLLVDLRDFKEDKELFNFKELFDLTLCSSCFLPFNVSFNLLFFLSLYTFLKMAIKDIKDIISPKMNTKKIPVLTLEKFFEKIKQNKLNKKNPK
jgi:hypothetical protein